MSGVFCGNLLGMLSMIGKQSLKSNPIFFACIIENCTVRVLTYSEHVCFEYCETVASGLIRQKVSVSFKISVPVGHLLSIFHPSADILNTDLIGTDISNKFSIVDLFGYLN